MERIPFSQKRESGKTLTVIHSSLTAALLFLGACDANANNATGSENKLYAPVKTYCSNYEDYVSVQPDGLWTYSNIEKNGDDTTETIIRNIHSQSEAISHCTE